MSEETFVKYRTVEVTPEREKLWQWFLQYEVIWRKAMTINCGLFTVIVDRGKRINPEKAKFVKNGVDG